MTTVLITGCSPGGIGHALAVAFHQRGCQVIATARSLDLIQDLRDLGMSTLHLNVTDDTSITACRDQVAQLTQGKLDILVNNAGRRHTIPALDISLPDVRATYETNVFGPMRMVQAFSSLLISAQGLIINISSNSTLGPYLFGSIFSSSKAAINAYSRALRLELQPFRVRVMLAMTGTVRSDVASHANAYRDLPRSSVYLPIKDLFKKRLTYSQNASTMPTAEYAGKLVQAALRGPGWWGGWVGGTPDIFWGGGMATTSWVTTWLPDWMTDILTGRFFGLPVIVQRIRRAADGMEVKRA